MKGSSNFFILPTRGHSRKDDRQEKLMRKIRNTKYEIRNTAFYFDYAAATPISPRVLAAMQPYFQQEFYNLSAVYLKAQKVNQAVNKARGEIAKILGAKPSEIIFTAGGTEADNLAVSGVMQVFADKKPNCVVSAIEHEAVLEAAKQFNYKLAPVKKDGLVDLDKLKKLIDEKTVLVSVMLANNEIGTVEPLAQIAKILAEIKVDRAKKGNDLPLYLHTDASQAPNYLKLYVNTLGVDLMSLNAGKIYGPKETGALYIKTGTKLEPLIRGGGQERGYRSGTPNSANIIGFAESMKESTELRELEVKRLGEILNEAFKFIEKNLPKVVINGSRTNRLPNNLHITIPGVDNERLMMELDEAGFMVATGSACSASDDTSSHVLLALGLTDEDARSSLRITFGRVTKKDDVLALLKQVKALV